MDKGNRVTIKDIANMSGVSIATVSRVLNNIPGSCSAETEARIRDAAKELGYAPNIMARSLVTRKTSLVAVVVPDIHYYFFQEVYSGIESYLNKHGYRLLLCITEQNQMKENQFLTELSNGLVDGIIVSTLNQKEDNSLIKALDQKGFPIVTIERYGEELKDICNVRLDNALSAKLAVEHLLERGHEKIAFMRGPQEAINSEARYKGYKEALAINGIKLDRNLVEIGNYQVKRSEELTVKLLEREKFTALIAGNDLMAFGAFHAIEKSGKKVPDDISLMVLGSTMLTEMNNPELTAFHFWGFDIGEYAGKCIWHKINGEESKSQSKVFVPVLKKGGKSVGVIK